MLFRPEHRQKMPPAPATGTVRVTLAPTAGFCVKSKALQPAVCRVVGHASPVEPSHSQRLDVQTPTTFSIPKGTKVFINIAWDGNVPPPPEGSEEAVQRAMRGDAVEGNETGEEGEEEAWFVPVIVSEPRGDADKGAYAVYVLSILKAYRCLAGMSGVVVETLLRPSTWVEPSSLVREART